VVAGRLPAGRNLTGGAQRTAERRNRPTRDMAGAVSRCFCGHFRTVATRGGDGEDRDPSRERTGVQELDIQMTVS
jgi:hypothetical protein